MHADNVDYSRMVAGPVGDEDDPLRDPLVRELRKLTPYHPMWSDPVQVKQFRDGLYDNLRPKAKATSGEEDARLRQANPNDDEYLTKDGVERWNQQRKL